MARYFFLVLLIPLLRAHSQQLPASGKQFGLDTLQVSDQVEYITAHFSTIHSKGFDEAINLGNYALELSRQNHWHQQEGLSLMCLGVAFYLRGLYDKALPPFLKSSDIFDSLQDHSGIARLNNELAVFYRKQGDLDKMHACLDKSETSAKISGNLEALGTSYHHRGVALSQQGAFEEAQPYFQKVLSIRTELADSVGLGYIYLDFAEYEAQKGNTEKAFEFINKSSEIKDKIGDLQGLAINETIKGETLFAAKRYAEAIPYFEKCIALATPIGYTDLIRFTYEMIQKCYIELGHYEQAYENLLTSIHFKDSLFDAEKTKSILELQTKYETEKKEQQIALQQAEIAEQKAQNQRNLAAIGGLFFMIILLFVIVILNRSRSLKKHQLILKEAEALLREAQIEAALNSQESERKRFARDLHDGFGQMISVLNLNLKSLEKENADRDSIFENSSRILDDMYKELKGICFNLMPETLIKKGVVDAIKEFAMRINHAAKVHVEVDTFGMEERLSDLQEISIYRISQEWINNVIKYSDASQITLSLTRDESEITLLIEDNGSGFDKTLLTDSKGNGWKNLNSRTNLIKGEIELDTTLGFRGNTLIVNAPVQALSQQTTTAII